MPTFDHDPDNVLTGLDVFEQPDEQRLVRRCHSLPNRIGGPVAAQNVLAPLISQLDVGSEVGTRAATPRRYSVSRR